MQILDNPDLLISPKTASSLSSHLYASYHKGIKYLYYMYL